MPFVIILAIVGTAVFFVVEGGVGMPVAPSTAVQKIAKAIATAEGFYVQGSLPQRAHNPGDIEKGDIGYGTINNKTVFASDSQGWVALYAQVQAMLDNSSAIYGPTWTIQDVANEYVSGQTNPTTSSTNWADIVANHLGVSTDTPIGQVV